MLFLKVRKGPIKGAWFWFSDNAKEGHWYLQEMDPPYVSKIRQESSLAIVDRWTVALLNSLLGKAEEMVDVDSKVTICQKTLDKDSRREKCFFQFKPRLSWHLPIIFSGSDEYRAAGLLRLNIFVVFWLIIHCYVEI